MSDRFAGPFQRRRPSSEVPNRGPCAGAESPKAMFPWFRAHRRRPPSAPSAPLGREGGQRHGGCAPGPRDPGKGASGTGPSGRVPRSRNGLGDERGGAESAGRAPRRRYRVHLVGLRLLRFTGCPTGSPNSTPVANHGFGTSSSPRGVLGIGRLTVGAVGGPLAATLRRRGGGRDAPIPHGREPLESAWRFHPAGGDDLYAADREEGSPADGGPFRPSGPAQKLPPRSTAFASTTIPVGPMAYGWTDRAWAVRRILRMRSESPTRRPSDAVE